MSFIRWILFWCVVWELVYHVALDGKTSRLVMASVFFVCWVLAIAVKDKN